MNCMQILVRTIYCGVQLNVVNSDRSLDLPERPISVNVLTWFRASGSHFSEWKLLLSPCLCLIGNSQLGYHFFVGSSQGIRNLTFSSTPRWILLKRPLLWILGRTARPRDMNTILRCYYNVYGWLRTAPDWGLAIVLPDEHIYQQCSAKICACKWIRRYHPEKTEGELSWQRPSLRRFKCRNAISKKLHKLTYSLL
jgi:hypothetical protein